MTNAFRKTLTHVAADDTLHTSYLYVLSNMDNQDLEVFKEIWPTIATQRRRDVLQELIDITETNFEVNFDPVFLLAMGDIDAETRALAIKGLWEYDQVSLIRPLIHLLKNDEAERVREAAASALGKFIYLRELEEIDPPEATLAEEVLLESIYQASEDLHVRRRAMEAVSYSGDQRIPPIIEAAYYSDDEKMQVSAIFAMGRNADERWLPIVITELDNPINEIRFEACRACGELEAKDAVGKLIELIEFDADLEIQEMAIWALGRIGGNVAREALEACLEHDQEVLALAAEAALEELNIFDDGMMLYDFSKYSDDGSDDGSVDLFDLSDYSQN